MKKKYLVLAAMVLSLTAGTVSLTSSAYTEEEKAWAKSMLQSYGYSPDMAGAQQAYQDYLSGKFNDICEQYGLPKQGVQAEPETEEPEAPAETERRPEREPLAETEPLTETEPSSEESKDVGSSLGADWTALFEEEETSAASGSIVMEEGQQAEDDGRVHFAQTRILEGVYEATLLEIWADGELAPPVFTENTETITCEEDLLYNDLVFRIKNLGTEELDVAELMQIAVSDGLADYKEGLLLKETENGSVFSEETTLLPEEEGIFHYALTVSGERGSFNGNVTLNGEDYKIYYKLSTHPKEREVLESGTALEAEAFGTLTLKEVSGTPKEGMKLTLTLQNNSDQEKMTSEFLGIMAVNGEKLLRVPMDGENILPEESKEVSITVEIPEEWEEETELLLYWQGNWYEVYGE